MKHAIKDALDARGYTDLTPVQTAVTNPELDGADLLVSAQTGSGKTVGFGLAIAPTLLGEGEAFDPADAPVALVIAPTRELALQVKRELAWLYGKAGAVLASCVGGMDMRDERRALARGAHVVVATPGRLRDHIMRGSIDLSALRAVVLDEADEMLDLGFREDLEFILSETPDTRRTLLFSATVPRGIANLAKSYQKDAVRVTTLAEKEQHADIDYLAHNVAQRDGENAIINVLRYHEAPNAIVFANTRAMVNRLTTRLSNRGFQVVSLSGELSQAERSHALQAMRNGRARVCVATDVAARGIDLPNLDLVIHAELPSSHETLLHRSGRTGRAGRKGASALIVTPKVRRKAERLLGMARLNATWGPAPSAEAVNERDEARMLADPIWTDAPSKGEEITAAKLRDAFTADQLATAYLRLYRIRQSAPEELSDPGTPTPRAPREAFGPSTWFSIKGGRNQNVDPRRLLPRLCDGGDITRDDIGAIRILDNESVFEIRETSVPGFVASLGAAMTVNGVGVVEQLDGKPDLPAKPPYKGGKGGKPDWKSKGKPHRKGGAERVWEDRPDPSHKSGPKPSPKKTGKQSAAHRDGAVTAPRKRSDDSSEKPRFEKPKSEKTSGKPTGKPSGKSPGKPTGKPAGKPAGKPYGKRDSKPTGPKPPAGKPSSKKNRARAKAAAEAKARSKGKKSGDARPTRRT